MSGCAPESPFKAAGLACVPWAGLEVGCWLPRSPEHGQPVTCPSSLGWGRGHRLIQARSASLLQPGGVPPSDWLEGWTPASKQPAESCGPASGPAALCAQKTWLYLGQDEPTAGRGPLTLLGWRGWAVLLGFVLQPNCWSQRGQRAQSPFSRVSGRETTLTASPLLFGSAPPPSLFLQGWLLWPCTKVVGAMPLPPPCGKTGLPAVGSRRGHEAALAVTWAQCQGPRSVEALRAEAAAQAPCPGLGAGGPQAGAVLSSQSPLPTAHSQPATSRLRGQAPP